MCYSLYTVSYTHLETRREAIINKIKELERFLEPEGAHFVLHLFTSKDVTEESYSIYNNCSLKILAMSQARIENYIEQLGKISLKHHKENVEMMKLVDKLIESIQSGKELDVYKRQMHYSGLKYTYVDTRKERAKDESREKI